MFTIYQGIYKITDNYVSYDHIMRVLFTGSDINWRILNVLPLGEAYRYKDFIFVREV